MNDFRTHGFDSAIDDDWFEPGAQDSDLRVLDLIRRGHIVKADDLRFWIGRDPTPEMKRLEEAGAIERTGPDHPHQHYRAVPAEECPC